MLVYRERVKWSSAGVREEWSFPFCGGNYWEGLDEGDGVWVTLAYRETEGILSGMSHVNKDI